MATRESERNQEATVYLVRRPVCCGLVLELIKKLLLPLPPDLALQGNLDERCNDALIWELMLQSGPICQCPAYLSSGEA